jgi:hypothetical protein
MLTIPSWTTRLPSALLQRFYTRASERQHPPAAFMATYRIARAQYFDRQPSPHTALDAFEYYDLWRNVNPEDAFIVTNHPGPFSIQSEFYRDLMGVDPPVTAVALSDQRFSPGIRRISPNPTSGLATLEVGGIPLARGAISLFDASGRRIRSSPCQWSASGLLRTALDLSDLPSGVYFVRVSSANGKNTASARRLVLAK